MMTLQDIDYFIFKHYNKDNGLVEMNIYEFNNIYISIYNILEERFKSNKNNKVKTTNPIKKNKNKKNKVKWTKPF